MGINKDQLEKLIINTLRELSLKMATQSAVNLLLGTAEQESHMGKYIHQIQGPALGIFQMEPKTHNDIWENCIAHFSSKFIGRIRTITNSTCLNPETMMYNLKYAIIMCRLHYWRVPEALPEHDDINALGSYWKKYYNTWMGKGTQQQFYSNYEKYVL